MSQPEISVVMPVWNGERHLREAVDSILNQTFRDFEFIILDDGSTDSTPAILQEYASRDSRIRIVRLDHQGIVVALNRGVAEAKAEWIARMDCDDIAHPERFERQWGAIRKQPETVLCHTQIKLIGEEKHLTKVPYLVRSHSLLKLRLCHQCPVSHPTVMFLKKAFDAAGGYLPEERHAEDYALWGRLIVQGRVIGISDALLQFRVHSGSVSKKNLDTQIALSRKISMSHCMKFMRLTASEAERAQTALIQAGPAGKLQDWFWFLYHCLPGLEKKGIELWMWVARQTFRRLAQRLLP